MDEKTKEELLISLKDLKTDIKENKILVLEIKRRVKKINSLLIEQKLDVELFVPADQRDIPELLDTINFVMKKICK
jgi:predicted Rossmann-fold nucleotide-binding protein